MADLFRKTKSKYASTTNTFGTGDSETITPNSITGLPTDTEITLTFDRVDSTGTKTPTKMERIIGVISGGNFVSRVTTGRGADGSTEQAHTAPVVEYIPNAKDINDLIDGILVEHGQDGTHAATIIKTTSTQTLTNKRVTKRVTAITSNANPTINTDNCDVVDITAQAAAIASMTTNLSGTPTNFQGLIIRIKDDGTARAITWGAKYEARGTALPTTTVISKVLTVGFIYDTVTAKWGCVASAQEV